MMPSDAYRLYQVERLKTAAEIRRADEHAGRFAATVARLVRGAFRPARPAQPARPARPAPTTLKPRPGMARAVVSRVAEPAGRQAG
jgi:hypothetical protein